MSHVFISYSHEDSSAMERVSAILRDNRIESWVDRSRLKPGKSWGRGIEKAIQTCDAMIVLLSPSAKESEYVEREILFAMVHERAIYPVLIKGSQQTSIPIHLVSSQYVDATGNQFSAGLQALITDIPASSTTDNHGAEVERPAPTKVRTPEDWRSVSLRSIATISRSSSLEPRELSDGQYALYAMNDDRSSTTDQFSYEGKATLVSAVWSGSLSGMKPMLRIVDGRFAVKRNLFVIQAKQEYMTEYLARYMYSYFDWPSMLVPGLLPYLSMASLQECQVMIPRQSAELEALCARVTKLESELRQARLRMELQMQLLDELEMKVFQSLLPRAKSGIGSEA